MHLLTTSMLITVTELASDTPQFFRRIGVNFNGRFLDGCCWLETHAIATSSTINKGLYMWSFGIFKFLVKMILSRKNLPDLLSVCLIFICFDICIEQKFIYGSINQLWTSMIEI